MNETLSIVADGEDSMELLALLKNAGMAPQDSMPVDSGGDDTVDIGGGVDFEVSDDDYDGDLEGEIDVVGVSDDDDYVDSVSDPYDYEDEYHENVIEDDEEEEDWDNTPHEKTSGIEASIPSGNDMHKSKKAYPAAAGGDNPMAIESMERKLMNMLDSFLNESLEEEKKPKEKSKAKKRDKDKTKNLGKDHPNVKPVREDIRDKTLPNTAGAPLPSDKFEKKPTTLPNPGGKTPTTQINRTNKTDKLPVAKKKPYPNEIEGGIDPRMEKPAIPPSLNKSISV